MTLPSPARRASHAPRAARRRAGGLTLIELLVAMVIGLGVTLAVSSIVVVGENHKRTSTSTNDAEQNGAYAFYVLDRALRSAGSGFAESAFPTDRGVLGCKLNAASILPATTAFPAPFHTNFLIGAGASATATLGNLRVAPVLIGPGQSDGGSDVLLIMGGSGAAGGVPRQVTGTGTSTTLVLDNYVGFSQYDLAIVSQSGPTDCLLEEVASTPTTPTITIGGIYYTTGSTTTISALATSTASYVTPIGNAAANNLQFQLFGTDANRVLSSYDLLQNLKLVGGTGTGASQPVADGVDQLYAIYGLATNVATPGVQTAWAGPADAGYDLGTVMTTPATMKQIVAVRVALVVRSSYFDKHLINQGSLTLFTGLTNAGLTSLQKTVVMADGYRYRVFEFTVPLRNMLLLATAT